MEVLNLTFCKAHRACTIGLFSLTSLNMEEDLLLRVFQMCLAKELFLRYSSVVMHCGTLVCVIIIQTKGILFLGKGNHLGFI